MTASPTLRVNEKGKRRVLFDVGSSISTRRLRISAVLRGLTYILARRTNSITETDGILAARIHTLHSPIAG